MALRKSNFTRPKTDLTLSIHTGVGSVKVEGACMHVMRVPRRCLCRDMYGRDLKDTIEETTEYPLKTTTEYPIENNRISNANNKISFDNNRIFVKLCQAAYMRLCQRASIDVVW